MSTRVTYLRNDISYVEAEGKLDIYSSQDYLDDVKRYLHKKFTKVLILEFSKITFVASIGLRAILEIHKIMQRQNGLLKLKNVNKEVLRSFQLTGFDKFLIFEYDSDNSEEKEASLNQDVIKYDEYDNNQPEKDNDENTLSKIVKTELSDIIDGLNHWYFQVASIMGCNTSGGSIELNIIQTLLKDDKGFNETIAVYEKISKNQYVNEWTHQLIPFNGEIQQLFGELIPKLKEIRTKIKND